MAIPGTYVDLPPPCADSHTDTDDVNCRRLIEELDGAKIVSSSMESAEDGELHSTDDEERTKSSAKHSTVSASGRIQNVDVYQNEYINNEDELQLGHQASKRQLDINIGLNGFIKHRLG